MGFEVDLELVVGIRKGDGKKKWDGVVGSRICK